MKFEKPDLTGLDRAAILAARADAVRLAGEIDNGEDTLPAESLEALEQIAEFLAEADAAVEKIDTDAAEQAERLAKARGGIAPKEEAPAEEEPKAEEPKAEETAKEEEPVLVASGRKSVVAKAARQTVTAPEVSTKSTATITAAADVPGIPTGKTLDSLDEVAEAALSRFAAMPRHRVGNQRNRYGLASITKGRDDEFSFDNPEFKTMQDLVTAASKESRLSGGSLVAAGGWCAPSETLYDLCTIESTDGLWDVPEVRAPRGGIQFTKGPSFADIYALGGFLQTEAQAEAGTEKDCWDVECPDFTEVRMDAIGLCIRAGILTNAAYPELIRRYLEGALIAQQHRVSGNLIQRALTITGAATAIANPWQNATAILTALEVAIAGERQRNRLPLSMTLEVVLPFWVKAAVRADLSQRTGVDMLAVTDQQIESYFTVRGARVQWVYNWQEITLTGAAPATDFPATVEALMYPAGTFVKLSLDVITLDAVYDSTNITTNTYTALFAEEGIALANTCFDAKRISLPLSVSGLTAGALINQDWNAAPPLYVEDTEE